MSSAEIRSWRCQLEDAATRCRDAVAAADSDAVRDALADLAALAVTAIPPLIEELEKLRAVRN